MRWYLASGNFCPLIMLILIPDDLSSRLTALMKLSYVRLLLSNNISLIICSVNNSQLFVFCLVQCLSFPHFFSQRFLPDVSCCTSTDFAITKISARCQLLYVYWFCYHQNFSQMSAAVRLLILLSPKFLPDVSCCPSTDFALWGKALHIPTTYLRILAGYKWIEGDNSPCWVPM